MISGSTDSNMTFRPVRNADAEGLIALLERCFSEYPGVVVEPDGIDADLCSYATRLEQSGGEGFVLEQEGQIVALVSGVPLTGGCYQLKRIYLDASLRGSGMSSKMLRLIERRARACDAATVELWSDTRFERAHRFYTREGYIKTGAERELGDLSNSVEYQFVKTL